MKLLFSFRDIYLYFKQEELNRALEKANNQAEQLTKHLLEKDNEILEQQDHIDTLNTQ